MTIIYFIRHGQASFGAKSYDKLSTLGEEQAAELGKYFKKILKLQPYVVAGSMQRHQQTAKFALAECFENSEIKTDQVWNEFNHQQIFSLYDARFNVPHLLKEDIAKEQNPTTYLAQIFEGAIQRWTSGDHEQEYDEPWVDFKQRIETALQQLVIDLKEIRPKYAVVFTSGGVVSTVVAHVLGLNAQKTFELNWAIANSSLTTLRLIDDRLQLLSFNEHHYLKAENSKWLTWI